MTGNLDAKKACTGAMKLQKKYLKKVTFLSWTFVINLEFAFKIFLEVRKSETWHNRLWFIEVAEPLRVLDSTNKRNCENCKMTS